MKVGAKVREIRKGKGVTQTHINKKLGKSVGWLNNIEKGRRTISADELKQIADILEVSIDDFFKKAEFHVTCNVPTGTTGN